MGLALLRRMKKGGKAGSSTALGPPLPMSDAPMPVLAPPEPKPVTHHAGANPVVHIHIGPTSAEAPPSPEEPALPDLPNPALLRVLHDKIQAARTKGK